MVGQFGVTGDMALQQIGMTFFFPRTLEILVFWIGGKYVLDSYLKLSNNV
jgi:hypothetical protein